MIYKEFGKLKLSKPPAVLSIDMMFTWDSEIVKTECQCHLRIYKLTFDAAIVIVSDLPNNSGYTITEEALTLIPLVCNEFALYPTKTMWLEHYPQGDFKKEETFEQVLLFRNNDWSKRVKKEQIESLLGVKLG